MDEEEKPKKKKRWTRGKEMPLFSGKTWAELQSIWPPEERINSQIWRAIGFYEPAWKFTRIFMKNVYGLTVRMSDFNLVCFFMRVEEHFEDVASIELPIKMTRQVHRDLLNIQKSRITKQGLIEQFPQGGPPARYRVTPIGRMMIKTFVENLTQADNDMTHWASQVYPSIQNDLTIKLLREYSLINEKYLRAHGDSQNPDSNAPGGEPDSGQDNPDPSGSPPE